MIYKNKLLKSTTKVDNSTYPYMEDIFGNNGFDSTSAPTLFAGRAFKQSFAGDKRADVVDVVSKFFPASPNDSNQTKLFHTSLEFFFPYFKCYCSYLLFNKFRSYFDIFQLIRKTLKSQTGFI